MTYQSPTEIARQIIKHQFISGAGAPYPEEAFLVRVLHIALGALLMEEEGRLTPFSLLLGEQSDWSTTRAGPSLVIPFEPPVPLTAATLAKLALSTDPEHTHLAVSPGTDGDLIRGLCADAARPALSLSASAFPHQFAIRGVRPGGLVISHMGGPRAIVKHGQWRPVRYSPTDLSVPLQQLAVGVGDVWGHAGAAVCLAVAEQVARSGHGGTILVARDIEKAFTETSVKYRFAAPDAMLADTFRHALAEHHHGSSIPSPLGDGAQSRYAIQHAARLANVDGAVLMDFGLRLHGFGTVIKTEPTGQVEVQDASEGEASVRELQQVGGMRHQSAACFCRGATGDEPRVAYVASQDRSVSIFVGVAEKVSLLRNLDLAVV